MGPLVFKTSGAAFGVARWVRLPCAPATAPSCAGTRRTMPGVRPPSVEAVLRAAEPGLTGSDHAAVTAIAREIVAEERAALATGSQQLSIE